MSGSEFQQENWRFHGQDAEFRDLTPSTQHPTPGTFPLRVNDLKQFEYCPRIVFYNTVMPVERKSTVKMERGKEIELKLDSLEARRTLRRYRLAEGERRYHVWLSSDRLGLSGKLDLLIVTPEACYPVDFKHTRDRAAPQSRPASRRLCAASGGRYAAAGAGGVHLPRAQQPTRAIESNGRLERTCSDTASPNPRDDSRAVPP